MPDRTLMTKTIKASQARQQFSQLLNQVYRREARILVEKSGIPVAAIVSAQDLEQLAELEARRAERRQLLERMRARFADLPEEQIEQDVAQVTAKVRQEARASGQPTTVR